MEEAPDSLRGSTLAGYVLHERLGKGGSATVYRGEDATHKTTVRAIKVIRREQRSKFGKRFFEEARLLEKLVHPHIVRFYHAKDEKGHLAMALELLEGATLRKHLDDWRVSGEFPPLDLVIDIMCQASEGVAFAHAFVEVVVHRDLKPDNLFVTTKGITKVLDFGIARALDDAEREAMTTTGVTAIGTAAYLPPELWAGNELPTPASDVYSLGITLFESVAGRHPFQELGNPRKNQAAYMKAHLMDEVKPLREVRPDAPESLEKVITKATAKEPKVRFSTAKEFGEALRAVQRELAAKKERPAPSELKPSEPIGPGIHTTVPLPQPRVVPDVAKSAVELPAQMEPEHERIFPRLALAYGAGFAALGVAIAAAVWLGKQPGPGPVPPKPSASNSSTLPVPSASVIPAVLSSANADVLRCPANMLPIPRGTFKIGSDDGKADQKGGGNVTVEAFCLDETEVTVEAYAACVLSKGCAVAPTAVEWTGADVKLWSQFCNANRAGHENHPINCVDWSMADAYCKKNDKRLPTEPEWEYAARGTDGRKYPWDAEKGVPRKGLLNACGPECVAGMKSKGQTLWITQMYNDDDGFPDTAPVGSFPEGKSFYKVFDMAGNVREWTDTFYTPNHEPKSEPNNIYRVLRGGSWSNADASDVRAANRGGAASTVRDFATGFRCAKTP